MNHSNEIELIGIDGGNPLGFLAAVGAALVASSFAPGTKLFWRPLAGAWRPVISGHEDGPEILLKNLHQALHSASTGHFEIDKRLPFEAAKFLAALDGTSRETTPKNRRTADFLAAFGSEAVQDKGVFEDTLFRMVRSGDAAGQGLPHYALENRKATGLTELRRTLFEAWDYRDDGFSLRLDPLEDQRYALRWKNPSKSTLSDGPGTMLGANTLALEALPLFPSVVSSGQLLTTGFHRNRQRQTFFTWPIWECPLAIDSLRSLLAVAKLREDKPPRKELARMGILEVYRCQRIAQNQYYSNFTPAQPA
jgi:hypothetical protein